MPVTRTMLVARPQHLKLDLTQPPLDQLIRRGASFAKRRDRCGHYEVLPFTGIGDEIAVVAHVIDSAKVRKPNAYLGGASSNVVVGAGHTGKRKRVMMGKEKNSVAHFHFVSEAPIVALVCGKRILSDREHIRYVGGEIEANVPRDKAFNGVPNSAL